MDSINLATQIKNYAAKSGYDLCGIMKAEPFQEYAASLDEHLKRYPQFRDLYEELRNLANPQETAPWAKSIIVCIRRYNKYRIPPEVSQFIGKYYLCEHRMEYTREFSDLKRFEAFLRDLGFLFRKSSVPARWAAVKAGLGAFAKNNFVYTKFGSWVWIDAWLVDHELEYEQTAVQKVPCPPNCSRCIDACPTNALSEPLMMNRGLCVAQLSYYSTELPPEELREKMGSWLYGCDVCQDVCPLNHNQWEENEDFPQLDELAEYLTLERIVVMDQETYLKVIQPRFWYIEKNSLWIWKCNALRAMANLKDEKYHPYILKARNDENENVRTMALWAAKKLGI